MSLQDTPRANRLHIGIFGRRNSGKSSLINAICGHDIAVVSDHAGTTTDPVYKSMEIHPLGPTVLIDTAGFDDEGELAKLRIDKSKDAAEKTDIALIVLAADNLPNNDFSLEKQWIKAFKEKNIPVITVLNKRDLLDNSAACMKTIAQSCKIKPIAVSCKTGEGIDQLLSELTRKLPEDYDAKMITKPIVQDGDLVLLVTTSDIQAPKGRLILPQVQTIRELLDRKSVVLCVAVDRLEEALKSLKEAPDVIITDSQVFHQVYTLKPAETKLTSFSVLFAAYKGDIDYYVESVQAIAELDENSRVLIAEACTHAPLEEDIGRVKIPRILRKRAGDNLQVDIVSGSDFPQDLSDYDLIIHCGACMFNRRYLMTRIERAKKQAVPMTNYGIAIAYLLGILDKVSFK